MRESGIFSKQNLVPMHVLCLVIDKNDNVLIPVDKDGHIHFGDTRFMRAIPPHETDDPSTFDAQLRTIATSVMMNSPLDDVELPSIADKYALMVYDRPENRGVESVYVFLLDGTEQALVGGYKLISLNELEMNEAMDTRLRHVMDQLLEMEVFTDFLDRRGNRELRKAS